MARRQGNIGNGRVVDGTAVEEGQGQRAHVAFGQEGLLAEIGQKAEAKVEVRTDLAARDDQGWARTNSEGDGICRNWPDMRRAWTAALG
ncbi:MAG: hypothetical protein M1821_006443 [Bathelium mastoideum]|nr:MAG: hypothetical protein M1821_006443 [Bathelium mastoideum]KAI9693720.1 MAG: hypothetical protein M1822_002991 [Bathelium mastoideum]